MQVPISQNRIGIEAQGSPNTAIQPITQAAAGLDVAQAAEGMGQTISGIGQKLFDHMAAKRDFDMEQESNDRASTGLNELHNIHDEIKQKQGVNVVDQYSGPENKVNYPATTPGKLDIAGGMGARYTATQDDLPKDSYLGRKESIREQITKGLSTAQAQHALKVFDNGAEVLDRSVRQHIVDQTQIYQEQGIASRIATSAGIYAVNPFDEHSQAALIKAHSDGKTLSEMKGEDENTAKARQQNIDDMFAKEAIKLHPEEVDTLLSTLNLSPEGKATLQGAQLDMRQSATWNAVKNFRNPDGTSDLNKIMSTTENIAKSFPIDQQQRIISNVRTMANLQDAQLKDVRESTGRAFSNEAVTSYKTGVPYEQAHDSIKKYAFDPTDFNNKEKILQGIYFRDSSAYERMTEYWSTAQKREWDRIKATAQKDFAFADGGPDFKLYQNALLQEMFEAKATTPDAMQQIYLKSTKDQPTGEQRLWGLLGNKLGEKTEQRAKLAISVQQNQQIVDAVGGISKAISIARELGGVEKLAIGTPESQAVIELSTNNKAVTKKNVDFVISKHPEWKDTSTTTYDEE